jgi:pimeloyl-ACP methyl ester carboxylesterase
MPQATTQTLAHARLAPVFSGYTDVNGIKLYHEIYGQGEPLVLLHGGLMTNRRNVDAARALGEDPPR